jgi:cytoskeletal protein CcmA (bactofilin family)
MFNKSKQPSGADEPRPAPIEPKAALPPRPEPIEAPKPVAPQTTGGAASIISAALTVTGNLNCDGDIEVKGTIDGDVKARNVHIDEGGKVKGKIVAENAHINGSVRGQILAKKVALAGSANVQGDILHETLSIEAGAFLDGNCRRLKDSDRVETPPAGSNRETAKPGNGSTTAQTH